MADVVSVERVPKDVSETLLLYSVSLNNVFCDDGVGEDCRLGEEFCSSGRGIDIGLYISGGVRIPFSFSRDRGNAKRVMAGKGFQKNQG